MPPRSIARKAESWFLRHQRSLPWRATYDPYQVWVSEVMLQQTRMEVVLGRYDAFLLRFPTIAALASASEDDVTAAWSGLGYYRRARMLRTGAIAVMQRFGGALPQTAQELMSIDGIGRYTAGAIASIAFNRAAPIVDGNVARIVSRLFATHASAWPFADGLVNAAKSPRVFNQALMEIGALICKPRNPECGACPLRSDCAAYVEGSVETYPHVEAKESIRLTVPLYVIRNRSGRVLMQRVSGRLMRGMFHLPHGDTELFPGSSFAVRSSQLIGSFRHTITNRRIEFVVLTANWKLRTANYSWIDPKTLSQIPHPSYVRKALHLAGIVD